GQRRHEAGEAEEEGPTREEVSELASERGDARKADAGILGVFRGGRPTRRPAQPQDRAPRQLAAYIESCSRMTCSFTPVRMCSFSTSASVMSRSSTPLSSISFWRSAFASRLSSPRRYCRTVSSEISPWKSTYMFSKRYRTSSFTRGLLLRQSGRANASPSRILAGRLPAQPRIALRRGGRSVGALGRHRQASSAVDPGAWQT